MANVEFGAFKDGTIGSEIADLSWHWNTSTSSATGAKHVQIVTGPPGTADPDNGTNNAVLLSSDDTMNELGGTPSLVRTHGIGFKAGNPAWWGDGHVIWRVVAFNVPSGFGYTGSAVADEQHGPNNSGPVNNIADFQRGGYWRHYVRGNNAVNGSYAFQWIFGPNDGSPVDSSRNHQDWANGNLAVTNNQWVVFLYGMLQSSTGVGWFEAYHALPGDSAFTTDVTRKTGMYTAFPDPNTPFMSLYYNSGSGQTNGLKIAGGKYFSDYNEALAYASARFNIGVGGGSGVANTALPTITGTPQVGNTLTGHAGTWTGAPTLTYQWQWDQGIGSWTNVGGATTTSFSCTPTFAGAQVRLAETGNGTLTVYSNPVTVTAAGGGSVYRLSVTRAGGSRVVNPAGRVVGTGGGV